MTRRTHSNRLAAMLVVLCGVAAAHGALAQTVVIREFLFDVPGVLPSAEPEVVFSGSGGLTEADVFAVAP